MLAQATGDAFISQGATDDYNIDSGNRTGSQALRQPGLTPATHSCSRVPAPVNDLVQAKADAFNTSLYSSSKCNDTELVERSSLIQGGSSCFRFGKIKIGLVARAPGKLNGQSPLNRA